MPESFYHHLADYHMHTPLCKHASGAPWEYVQRAVELGLGEIGFSDHCPMPPWYDPDFRMNENQMSIYRQIVDDARRRFPDYPIKFGIEADFHPGTEKYIETLIKEHEFDYVIGSVHYIDDWGFDNPDLVHRYDDMSIEDIWEKYFFLWEQAICSGLFDVMAHPDLVKKFGHRPKGDLTRFYKGPLYQCMKMGVTIEVSTAGLRKPVGEIYPSEDFLKIARAHDIPIVISSDAHKPGEVGQDFAQAVELVRKTGYTRTVRFSGRQKQFIDLP
ncbi:histidinol-phosphatase HisJ family protein [Kamptonema cortianum]|nr:histidinol-phosphatase HisJ family protein [Oscillatoria laete-virens]MDK3161829.1 histidinol-phosphatase HisJ family protein [Kamptonema cortianum]MDL5054400.1 histidinol-phosphatase HisJ family protein [Oscillatoria laete-virens NRMC-F 0139]